MRKGQSKEGQCEEVKVIWKGLEGRDEDIHKGQMLPEGSSISFILSKADRRFSVFKSK